MAAPTAACLACRGSGCDPDSPEDAPQPCIECFGSGESITATPEIAGVSLQTVAAEVAAAVVNTIEEVRPEQVQAQSRTRSRLLAAIAILADDLESSVPDPVRAAELTEYERGQASANAAAVARLRAVVDDNAME